MEQLIYNEIIPPLIFFIVFSVVFFLLELILATLLNLLAQRHYEWIIDVLIRSEYRHRRVIKYIILIIVGVLLIGTIIYTPLVAILTTASSSFKIFAAVLALVILLILSINIRKSTQIRIGKKIYGVLFFLISLIIYVLILSVAEKSYDSYARYINENFVNPAVKGVENVLESREEARLLNKFRKSYLNNECHKVDYTKEEKTILIKNLQLIKKEPELAFGDKNLDITDPEKSLKGMACSDGESTFLLIENGSWYWVNEEYIKFIK